MPKAKVKSRSQTSQVLHVNNNQINAFVRNAVNFILNHSRNWQLVSRKNIIANTMIGNIKVVNKVFEQVEEALSKIYGYKLEIANKGSQVNMHKYFLLIEDINEHYHEYVEFREDEKYILLLRYMILVHLHLCGNNSSEESLREFLNSCGIPINECYHKHFGNIKKHIIDFQKQNYIVVSKDANGVVSYAAGNRAIAEYDGRDLENWYKNVSSQFL